jgi:hypothetical protein
MDRQQQEAPLAVVVVEPVRREELTAMDTEEMERLHLFQGHR